jgi:hypothetical protein
MKRQIDPSRQLIDQSELPKRRGKKLVASSRDRIDGRRHQWQQLAVGRVCTACLQTQADGEIDDDSLCQAS